MHGYLGSGELMGCDYIDLYDNLSKSSSSQPQLVNRELNKPHPFPLTLGSGYVNTNPAPGARANN